jgi:hypothetical protein
MDKCDLINSAIIKLGVATLFRVAKIFFHVISTLIHGTLWHSRVAEFWKYFEKCHDTKSLRTPALTY